MSGISLKILIADDTPTNVKQLEILARRSGHIPVLAHDGQSAVDQFQAESPDLVFMDIMTSSMVRTSTNNTLGACFLRKAGTSLASR